MHASWHQQGALELAHVDQNRSQDSGQQGLAYPLNRRPYGLQHWPTLLELGRIPFIKRPPSWLWTPGIDLRNRHGYSDVNDHCRLRSATFAILSID